MRRTRSPNRPALARGTSRLIHLANEWAEASSKFEDQFWARQIASNVDALLKDGDEKTLTTALDQLWSRAPRAHDLLADLVEARAESETRMLNGQAHDFLLLAVPVLAWSRDRIPAGKISNAQVQALSAQLAGHVLAKAARVVVSNALYSPDQLPHTYCESAELAQAMFDAMEAGKALPIDFSAWPETEEFVADTRLLLACVAVPAGNAFFRWQEEEVSREKVLTTWREQGGAVMQSVLTGCSLEMLMPTAFHSGSRVADRESRGFSLRAGVQFLEAVADLPPSDVVAVVAAFYDRELEEYRVSLMQRDKPDVLHGVVWPVLGLEAEEGSGSDEIEEILKQLGVTTIHVLDDKLPLEHCSDCGAPMFADPEGELIHAGFPEDDVPAGVRYH